MLDYPQYYIYFERNRTCNADLSDLICCKMTGIADCIAVGDVHIGDMRVDDDTVNDPMFTVMESFRFSLYSALCQIRHYFEFL